MQKLLSKRVYCWHSVKPASVSPRFPIDNVHSKQRFHKPTTHGHLETTSATLRAFSSVQREANSSEHNKTGMKGGSWQPMMLFAGAVSAAMLALLVLATGGRDNSSHRQSMVGAPSAECQSTAVDKEREAAAF